MARPLRIPLPGGIYHVTSRGNQRGAIYFDDVDRSCWLDVLGKVCARTGWRVHAWCQMQNHYHVVLETPEPNLSDGMRSLNGVYTQRINRRHKRCGHVFQGRFHAVLVERETHLLELSRYVVLNPVRAGLVAKASDWQWSSYRATVGISGRPPWMETRWVLAQFGTRHPDAVRHYAHFVQAGIGLPLRAPVQSAQSAAGGPDFVNDALRRGREAASETDLTEIPMASRHPPPPSLMDFELKFPDRNDAMARAYASGGFSMREIGNHFAVHRTTVARAVLLHEARQDGEK